MTEHFLNLCLHFCGGKVSIMNIFVYFALLFFTFSPNIWYIYHITFCVQLIFVSYDAYDVYDAYVYAVILI